MTDYDSQSGRLLWKATLSTMSVVN